MRPTKPYQNDWQEGMILHNMWQFFCAAFLKLLYVTQFFVVLLYEICMTFLTSWSGTESRPTIWKCWFCVLNNFFLNLNVAYKEKKKYNQLQLRNEFYKSRSTNIPTSRIYNILIMVSKNNNLMVIKTLQNVSLDMILDVFNQSFSNSIYPFQHLLLKRQSLPSCRLEIHP